MLRRSLCSSVLRSSFGSSSYCGVERSFEQKVQKRTGMFDSIADLVEKSGGMEKVKKLMNREFEGSSDDDTVSIVFAGDDSITSIRIDPSLKNRDIAVLERNVKEAVTKGLKAVCRTPLLSSI